MSYRVLTLLKRELLYLFVPGPCLACGGIDRDLEKPLGLCRRCRRRLEPIGGACCSTCALPLLSAASVPEGYQCALCRRRRPPVSRLVVRWVYGPPLDRVVLALKFSRMRYLGRHLGVELGERIARERWAGEIEGVVPVPLHWRRKLVRGYNQAEEIAATVAARLNRPLAPLLRRHHATKPQMELPHDERQRNLREAFRTRPGHVGPGWPGNRGRLLQPLGGARLKSAARSTNGSLLLIDDVVTTGATLFQAAACLRRAGFGPIFAAAVARTPEPAAEHYGVALTARARTTYTDLSYTFW